MIPSKSIEDYQPLKIDNIRPNEPLPFALYIYFRANNHIALLRPTGLSLDANQLNHYRSSGIKEFWVHHSESDQLEGFLTPVQPPQPEQPAQPAHLDPPAPGVVPSKPKTETPVPQLTSEDISDSLPPENAPEETPGAPPAKIQETHSAFERRLLRGILNSQTIPDEEKKRLVAHFSKDLIRQLADAKEDSDFHLTMAKARSAVSGVLESLADDIRDEIQDIWNMHELDAVLVHGINVATYSALFAMAFGRIDTELLSQLAVAGLLHDLGMSQIAPETASQPLRTAESAQSNYPTHVERSLSLIKLLMPTLSDRIVDIVHQHHEKFDGSGFPRSLEGFDFDDIAQLVAMAELIESVRSGRWDGENRDLRGAFSFVEAEEKSKTFPHFFNPEIFRQVLTWTQSQDSSEALTRASEHVARETTKLLSG